MSRKEILDNHLDCHEKPTFAQFCTKTASFISINIETSTALELQRDWVDEYNKRLQVMRRPNMKFLSIPASQNVMFKRVFKIASKARASNHMLRMAAIETAILANSEQPRGEQEEGASENPNHQDAVDEDQHQEFVDKILVKNQSTELDKLKKSKCINLISEPFITKAKEFLGQDDFTRMLAGCKKEKEYYTRYSTDRMDEEEKGMIFTLYMKWGHNHRDAEFVN